MNRRQFLSVGALGLSQGFGFPRWATKFAANAAHAVAASQSAMSKPFGSGHFGEWITDQFGLPAYRYTCNQITDPKAVSPTHKIWRGATDQTHQVGNDRIIAAVSNFGYLQVRQDEGSPKFLNDYSPEHARFGGGIGFLTDGKTTLSTYYTGNADAFDRIMGEGYIRNNVNGNKWKIDQVVFAPFGDDPV